MSIQQEVSKDYRSLLGEFAKTANADPTAGEQTISKLSTLFQSAVQKKSILLRTQNVQVPVEDIARGVANDISASLPQKSRANESFGRPIWHMQDMHELFNWITENQESSTAVKGIAAGLQSLGISAPDEPALKVA